MRLFAFLRRKEGMSRDDFLRYWHEVHGPLIRETPELGGHLLRYEQHPAHANDRSGFDGVAVQDFAGWADLLAMLDGPAAATMRADEENFIDHQHLTVVFTDDPVVMVPGHVEPPR